MIHRTDWPDDNEPYEPGDPPDYDCPPNPVGPGDDTPNPMPVYMPGAVPPAGVFAVAILGGAVGAAIVGGAKALYDRHARRRWQSRDVGTARVHCICTPVDGSRLLGPLATIETVALARARTWALRIGAPAPNSYLITTPTVTVAVALSPHGEWAITVTETLRTSDSVRHELAECVALITGSYRRIPR
jgi:hypothetical protein